MKNLSSKNSLNQFAKFQLKPGESNKLKGGNGGSGESTEGTEGTEIVIVDTLTS